MPIKVVKDSKENNFGIPLPNGGGFDWVYGLLIAVIVFVLIFAFTQCGKAQPTVSFGAEFSQEKDQEVLIYEPLLFGARELPDTYILKVPIAKNQGAQGSCVGWSSAYAARSILYAEMNDTETDDLVFSPSYLYNQIALYGCQGAYITDALKYLKKQGVVPFEQFPYDPGSCSVQPNASGIDYQIDGYQRFVKRDGWSHNAIKEQIASGHPVVIGMYVGGTFTDRMWGQSRWHPFKSDYAKIGFGGHAMCVAGYNEWGYLLFNSWGTEWGKNGKAWVSYDDFDHFVVQAYAMYDKPAKNIKAEVSVWTNDGLIPLRPARGSLGYENALPVGRFKIGIDNNEPLFCYVVGEGYEGKSFALFPYTEGHDPYLSVTGQRVIPDDFSFYPPNGEVNRFALYLSRTPLDLDEIIDKLENVSDWSQSATEGNYTSAVSRNGVIVESSENTISVVIEIK